MTVPLDITVRDIEKTPFIEEKIRQKADKLTQFYDRIESIKAVIEVPQNHKHNGKLFSASLEVLVPNKKLIVNRKADENLYIAIRDAFAAMTSQVKEYSAIQRGDIKNHSEHLAGVIDRLFNDYGFIRSTDGREFYFHADSVVQPAFDALDIGFSVRFIESETTGESLQANHIIANGTAVE